MNKTAISLSTPLCATFALCCALVLFGVAKPGPAAETCTSLLQGRCESCHYLTRVCEKVAEKKGKWSWKRTVKNMVKQGAKLNDEERDLMVDCLSQPAPEVLKLCGPGR